jgi:homoaconitase/3-isopropylmalate dehydratase large subunit
MARDIDFQILGRLKNDFASYRAVEFTGSTLATLDVDERSTLTNAGIEMGAKNTIVPFDERTADWYGMGPATELKDMRHDPEATFETTHTFDVGSLAPQIALPHRVDLVEDVTGVAGTSLTAAHIGSCVGAKLSDLRAAATIVRDKSVRIPFLVTPATRAAYNEALEDGTAKILADAGAILQAPGCGPCAGVHMGILGDDDRIIASVTRNFRGRMGGRNSEIYLGSPASTAASALEGQIADPRQYVQ